MFRAIVVVVGLSCLCTDSSSAQGLRVSTVVYDAGRLDGSGREVEVSNSFSLFHNSRVYDYLEAAGEVVIFDPIARKFVVMSPERKVYTTIAFAQLNGLLAEREPRTRDYIEELTARKSPEARTAARQLQFQLNPEFETKTWPSTGALMLKSPSWKYEVSTREWDDVEQLSRYLDYADWTARLNCVLYPSSRFPEPRVALNDELRKLKNRMPVIVKRDTRPDENVILRAEHQYVRSLTDRDRSLINAWNGILKDADMKELPFRSYQERVLLTQSR